MLSPTLQRFRLVSRQDFPYLHGFVVEEALGGLGLRPIATGLIERPLGPLGESPTELEESRRPAPIPQAAAPQFLPRPMAVAARLPPSLPKVLVQEFSLEVCLPSLGATLKGLKDARLKTQPPSFTQPVG